MLKIFILVYNMVVLIFLAPILIAIALSGKRNRNDFFYKIKERLVIYENNPVFDKNKKTVWVHCASLGEARAVEPMMEKLKQYNIAVTVITKSAREYVSKLSYVKFCALAPVDLYPFAAKAVSKIKPDILLVVETEFWPSLIYCASAANAKIITVNGRLSKTAFPYYKATSAVWKIFLKPVTRILVRNEQDYERFSAITDMAGKIEITGNIKYDRDWRSEGFDRSTIGFDGKYFLFTAGSTRDGEEEIILDVFEKLKQKYINLRLIIAPRHISRVPEIEALIKNKNIKYTLFSDSDKKQEDILLVDVFGKLQMLYSVSDLVFIGGSLIKKGGQNPIEASAYAKPVIFGQHMYNFENEAKLLKNCAGAFEVSDAASLEETADRLISDEDLRIMTGNKGFKAVEEQKGAINKNLEIIEKYINE